MKIAFISYEYPPDTAHGGIATYVEQAAKMLAGRNHSVEVFAGSSHRTETNTENGVVVHRFVSGMDEFRFVVGPRFAERHALVGFDVLEGPEYKADASDAVHRVVDIPLVIKLHTPSFMINRMNRSATTPMKRLRFHIGDIKRDMFPGKHSKEYDSEYLHILDADVIAFPSRSLGWHLKKS